MKKISKLVVSLLVVAAIAACGASPRDSRYTKKFDKTNAIEAALPTSDPANVDAYWNVVGDGATLVPSTNYVAQGINLAGLSIAPVSVSFIEITVLVDRVTKECAMKVGLGIDGNTDGSYDGYLFKGTQTSTSTGLITCTVGDSFSSNVQVQLTVNGSLASAYVMDSASTSGAFLSGYSLQVNPVVFE